MFIILYMHYWAHSHTHTHTKCIAEKPVETEEAPQWSITLWEAQTFPKTERTVSVLVESQSMQLSLAAAHTESFSMFVCFSQKQTNMHTAQQRSSWAPLQSQAKSNKQIKKKFYTERVTLIPETNNPLVCSYSVITWNKLWQKALFVKNNNDRSWQQQWKRNFMYHKHGNTFWKWTLTSHI